MKQLLPWNYVEIVIQGVNRALLYGPPGTGKTTAALNAAKALGRTAVMITLTDQTPAARLEGHWIPTKTQEFTWLNGVAVDAAKHGWVLVLDEIDKASDDCFDFLHGLLNDNSVMQISLPNGETITPHPDFKVIATMNGDLQDLLPALRDRFREGSIEIVDPHPDALAALPEDLQAIAANPQSYDDHERPATLRAWKAFNFLRNLEGLNEEIAAQVVFGNRSVELMDAIRLRDASKFAPVIPDSEKFYTDNGYYYCATCDSEWHYEEDAISCWHEHDENA